MTTEPSLQYVEVYIIKTTMFHSNMIRFMYPNYDYISNNDTIIFSFNDGTIIDNTNINETDKEYKIKYYNPGYIYTFYVKNNKFKLKTLLNGSVREYINYDKNSLFMSSIRNCTYYNVKTQNTSFKIDRLKDDDTSNLKFMVAYDKDIFDKNDVVYLTSKILTLP
jgi:hypothetical protein